MIFFEIISNPKKTLVETRIEIRIKYNILYFFNCSRIQSICSKQNNKMELFRCAYLGSLSTILLNLMLLVIRFLQE